MERRRFTLGGAMALIAVISLVMALIVQTRRAAEREARYQAEIANLRAELTAERLQLRLVPKPSKATDNH
jgi:hypothetical protein